MASLKDQILVEENLFTRTLILNRPKQLNALSTPMLSRLMELFLAFEKDPKVKLIILKGNGRAFCAGGDIISVVRDIREGGWRKGSEFYAKEFSLMYVIATYAKSQVSILNGFVMGVGGALSTHGRFRIATENSVFAMPETSIGNSPDVGGSYFLSRLPGFFGEYLGLTGARFDGAEMLACGLATHFVPSEKLPLLEEALKKVDSSDAAAISSIIDRYSQQPNLKEQSALNRLDVIGKCFSKRSVEDILSALEKEAENNEDAWITNTIHLLNKASPISLKFSLQSIRGGRLQGLDRCLIREFRLVCHVLQGKLSKDFLEGCRAVFLDKDKNPKWEPSRLEVIGDDMVDQYFLKMDEEGWEDLRLPARFDLPAYAMAKL